MFPATPQSPSFIQQFPGYFTVQVHPEEEFLVSNLEKINAQFAKAHPLKDHQITELLNQSVYPDEKLGYICALKYIEDHLLSHDFSHFTEETFLLEIKKINFLVVQNEFGRGEYRPGNLIVWNDVVMPKVEDRNANSFKQIDAFIVKDCTEEQKILWKETRKKIWEIEFAQKRNPKVSISFSDVEKKLIKGLADFPPDFAEVAELMRKFAQELFLKIKEKEDLFTLMGWVHQKLIDIHPFTNGNGRTARLIMTAIGMWNGKKPLLVTDNVSYSASARSLDPKQFADYLRSLETKQIHINDLVNQTLRSSFEHSLQNLDWSVVKSEFKRLYKSDFSEKT